MATPRTAAKTTMRKAAATETASTTRHSKTRAGNSTGNGAGKRKTTFEIDADLLDEAYNQVRRPQLPYGIVVNDKPAGILVPLDQLDKAGWLEIPTEEELSNITFGENEVTGLLISEARLLILAFVPEYIRYKSDVEAVGSTVVGPYEDYRPNLDKKTMDVCAEHALVFLDEDNQPLHMTPIVVRFKNVALWSFKSAREEYYRKLEKAFAEFTGQRYSGKSDKWRSLGVLEVEFKAVKEGEGKNKSWCCKTEVITSPAPDNLPRLFLGAPTTKALVWGIHDDIAGFTEPQALPALSEASGTKAVTTVVEPKRNLRYAKPLGDDFEEEEDFIDTQAETVDDEDLELEDDLDDDFDLDDEDDEE